MADQTPVMWHYHAKLECGHDISFDSAHNLLVEALEQNPTAEVVVELPCRACTTAWSSHSTIRRSVDLKVTEGHGPCEECE